MSKKITDITIEVNGKEMKKSSKNYVKVKKSEVSVSTKEIVYWFDALDYKGEDSSIKDLKLGDKTLTFHYLGKEDSDSEDSDDSASKGGEIDTKVKVIFNSEESFAILQKAFKKKEKE